MCTRYQGGKGRANRIERCLEASVIGQPVAVTTLAKAIRRYENGWCTDDHPPVFLFLGPSGTGKTELAKQIAKYHHKNNEDAFIRLDMSEYQERHSVSRMIGSPPGYIGSQEGGYLTKALKKCNSAVVLFDEIEKAHPKMLTILLQLFDEGRLTDGLNETIKCRDATFIMTSNLASGVIARYIEKLRLGLSRDEESGEDKSEGLHDVKRNTFSISREFNDEIVRPILKEHFKLDELLGRISETIYFFPFSPEDVSKLATREMESWARKIKHNRSIELSWEPEIVKFICKGYNIVYGARSIKHEVETGVITEISECHSKFEDQPEKIHVSVERCEECSVDHIKVEIE